MFRTILAGLLGLVAMGCADIAGKERARAPGDFTLEELVGVRSLADGAVPDWSPDGATLVFVGRDSLWTIAVAGGTPQALPVSQPSNPAHSPDGKWIGYVSGSGNDQDVWLWSIADRRATRLTNLGARMSSWSWSPDSRGIALSSLHRGNYDVYAVQVPDGQVRRLTTDTRYDVYPTWTPDSRAIVYVRMDDAWVNHEVITIDAATGSGERVIVTDTDFFDYRIGAEFGPAQVSPNGELVLFRSHRSNWLNWWLVPFTGGRPRPLAAESADQNAQKPFRGYARWSPDGQRVAYTSDLNGTMVLRVAAVEAGEVKTIAAPDLGVVANLAWSPDSRRIAYTFDSPRQPMDLYVVDVESRASTRLTRSLKDSTLTDALFSPQKIRYPSTAGLTINAYLYQPATPAPPGGHPAIVWIHGGPTSQFDDGWGRHWEAHYYIKHGYAVLLPNIRGSSGYGRDFEKLSERCWGRCDMEDVVAGVKYLRTLPDVNADRVAATGTSYGGFMSIAAGTFAPGVFRAALPTGSGYSDWLRASQVFFPLAEIKLLDYELGSPERNRDVYLRTSPFYHASRMDTPMLLVGADDADTPMRAFANEATRYYKPVRYLGLAQSGSPAKRLEWMPQALAFLDRHVKGPVELNPAQTASVVSAPAAAQLPSR